MEEVPEVMKSLKLGSAPGLDGFSSSYFKKFGNTLAPSLTRLFNSLQEGNPIESDLNRAFISVILKSGKDGSDVNNYRPISLINNDIKIMTKILANRMSDFIAKYIHKDQAGFIPGSQGLDQVRRAINIISLLNSNWVGGAPQEGFLVSIDLQKAFNTAPWPYLFDILGKWGFAPTFWVSYTLYTPPRAHKYASWDTTLTCSFSYRPP